jgi:hypothetical protein
MLDVDSSTLISLAEVIMCTNYSSSKVRGSFITYMNEPFFPIPSIRVKNELGKVMEVGGKNMRHSKWKSFRF